MSWGTKEEIYRHKCMQLLKFRYCYYVLNNPLISDTEYDNIEHELEEHEKKQPELVHEKSPTKVPGSNRAEDYPRSIRMLFKDKPVLEKKKAIATLW